MRNKFVSILGLVIAIAVASYGIAVAADAAKGNAEPAKESSASAAKPASATSALSPDAVVAKINGVSVKGSELLELKNGLRPPANQMPIDAVYGELQDRLINGKLVFEAAKKAKLADDKEVKEKLAKAQERIMQDVYLTREVGSKITTDAVQARYNKLAGEYKPQTELKARHILVATEAEAKSIAEQLKKGGDFAKLAKEKSTDKSSAENGGDLGFFTADQVVEPFSKTAFALKDNEVSAPVQSQFGWHVIQALSRRDTKMPSLDDARSDVQRILADEMINGLFAKLRKEAKIEKFGLDGKVVADAPAAPAPAASPDKKTQ